MKRWMHWPVAAFMVLCLSANYGRAASAVSKEVEKQANAAIERGISYLLERQKDDGSWTRYPQPAIAALCVLAIHGAEDKAAAKAVEDAMAFVMGYVREDGSVQGKARRRFIFFKGSGYPTYTTSIALLAMATVNKPEYVPIMRAAREYLKELQLADPDSKDYGSFGYDRAKRGDMSNTSWATEALHATAYLDREPHNVDPKVIEANKKMWTALSEFLKECQSLPEQTGADAAVTDAKNDGGFRYRSDSDLVSSGAMTYAGLKSMIYANVDRRDARVRGAMSYVQSHYNLNASPSDGQKGLFYYLQTLTKALHAFGADELTLKDGQKRNWREDVIRKFASMQQADGSWQNKNGRHLEALPELATAYSLISLKFALTKAGSTR